MSANRIDLQGYVEALRDTIPDGIDRVARAPIDEWLSEMSTAADIGDEQAAARLAWMVSERIELELERKRHHQKSDQSA